MPIESGYKIYMAELFNYRSFFHNLFSLAQETLYLTFKKLIRLHRVGQNAIYRLCNLFFTAHKIRLTVQYLCLKLKSVIKSDSYFLCSGST